MLRLLQKRSTGKCATKRLLSQIAPFCLVLAVAEVALCSAASPVTDSEVTGVVLHFQEHPALGDSLAKRIKGYVERMLWTLLGSDADIVSLDVPDLARWLDRHDLDALTENQCSRFNFAAVDKVIILSLRCFDHTYRLAAVEYDRRFGSLGPVQHADVLQRFAIPDTVGRLALKCWSAVGVVLLKERDQYLIRFKDPSQLAQVAEWSRLRTAQPLQLHRELRYPDGRVDRQSRADDFLVINRISQDRVTAQLAFNAAQDRWFEYLGHPRASYFVRILDPEPGPVAVTVVVDSTDQPRQGCKVFLSEQRPTSHDALGIRMGITDYDGRALFNIDIDRVGFVSIVYGRHSITKAFVRTFNSKALLFRVRQREESTTFEDYVSAFEDNMGDKVLKLNALHQQLSEAVKIGDVKQADDLVEKARHLIDISSLRSDLQRLRSTSPNNNSMTKTQWDELENKMESLQQQLARITRDHERSQREARRRELRNRIELAWQSQDWKAVETLCTESLANDPTDTEVQGVLERLRQSLASKNPEHAAAQAVVREAVGIVAIDELLAQWDELDAALNTLVDNQDQLLLAQATKQLVKWKELIQLEIERIKKASESKLPLSERERDELQWRKDDVGEILTQLSTTEARVNNLLTQGSSGK